MCAFQLAQHTRTPHSAQVSIKKALAENVVQIFKINYHSLTVEIVDQISRQANSLFIMRALAPGQIKTKPRLRPRRVRLFEAATSPFLDRAAIVVQCCNECLCSTWLCTFTNVPVSRYVQCIGILQDKQGHTGSRSADPSSAKSNGNRRPRVWRVTLPRWRSTKPCDQPASVRHSSSGKQIRRNRTHTNSQVHSQISTHLHV